MWKKIETYLISILISLGIGGFAAVLTVDNIMLYSQITTPPLSLPGFLFPVVWTVLYILMGVGSARVWMKKETFPKESEKALKIYAIQLFFNFFWSLIFFNAQAFLASFVWLVALWILIIVMLIKFARIDLTAALINIPYLLWVTFAGYLNFAIYILN